MARPGNRWMEEALPNLIGENVVLFLKNGKGVNGTLLSAGEGVVVLKRTKRDGQEVLKVIRVDIIEGLEVPAEKYEVLPDPLAMATRERPTLDFRRVGTWP